MRDIKIFTGTRGLEAINNAIRESAVYNILQSKHNNKKVTDEEYNSLKKMIFSSDKDNLELAVMIINQK